VIASLVEGRIALPYADRVSLAQNRLTPSWLPWGSLFENSQSSNAMRFLKLTAGWGLSYVTHFIGFGLIPVYLNRYWTAVKKSAQTLFEEEQQQQK
jgi:hypothetical protein